jgi:hypothetical protein
LPAICVEDPEGRPPPRGTEPASADRRLGPLADDVAAESNPGAPRQLEAQRGRLGHRPGETRGQVRRLDDEEERARPSRDGRDPVEAVDGRPERPARGTIAPLLRDPGTEVEHGHVDRPSLEERAGHRERLVERFGDEDREGVEPNAAGRCLERIERPAEVDPRRERAGRLRLGNETEGERCRAAGPDAPKRDRRRQWDAAGTENRVERREARRDDPVPSSGGLGRLVDGTREHREGTVDVGLGRPRVALEPSRSCRAPARPEGRESGGDVRGRGRHGLAE